VESVYFVSGVWQCILVWKLESVATVVNWNLRRPYAAPVILHFNHNAHNKVQVDQPLSLITIYTRVLTYSTTAVDMPCNKLEQTGHRQPCVQAHRCHWQPGRQCVYANEYMLTRPAVWFAVSFYFFGGQLWWASASTGNQSLFTVFIGK